MADKNKKKETDVDRIVEIRDEDKTELLIETNKNKEDGLNQFAARMKAYRTVLQMPQTEFAMKVGIPLRTYQNYETGRRYPKNMEVVNQAARALGTTAADLMGSEGGFIVEAGEKGTINDQRRMEQMVTQMSAMFAGGEIDEESKEKAMAALSEAYWRHKTENRQRFTPKKYRKDDESAEE